MNEIPWNIRAGIEADVPSVLALWRVAETQPSATDSEESLRLLLRRDPEALLVAEIDDEIVGSLIVGWDGWRGSFYRLAVHPDWRRRKIATALVREGEEQLLRLGAVRLTAIVADGKCTATALWEATGYRRQGDMSRFVRMMGND